MFHMGSLRGSKIVRHRTDNFLMSVELVSLTTFIIIIIVFILHIKDKFLYIILDNDKYQYIF